MPGFDPTQPFQVVGRDGPRYFPALDPVPPLTAAQIRDIKVEQGKATPQEILDYEHDQLTAEKGFLRAGLGIGEEGKGILRQALGSTITLGGKVVGNINPMAAILRRRGRNIGDQYIEEAGRAVSELGTENIREAREIGQELGGGETGEMIQDLGATFTASAPAIPAAILGGLPAAALTAGATQYGASREQYKRQFMAQGLPEQEAERRAEIPAALGGVITATLTRAIPGGSEMLLNRILSGEITKAGAAKFVANLVARELPSEMGEESLDQIGQGFVERLMVNPNKSFHEIAEETVNAATAAGLLTTFIGGGGAVVAKTGQAISEPIQNRLEESDFRRQSRRLADMQARAGFRPSGINTATERTYATTQREESNQQQYQPPPKQGLPTTPSGSDIVQPGTPPEAQAPIDTSNFIVSVQAPSGEVPGNIQIIDRTQTETSQSPTVESLRAAGLPVPDFSTLPQGQYPYAQAIQILQGGQRSPQQVPVREGAGTIPAAPPAIEIIGTPIPEHQPLLDQVMAKIQGENNLSPGLPVRRVNLVNSGPAIYTAPSEGGFDTVNINLPRMQEQAATRGLNVDQYLALAANEEVIHNAGGAASYDRWKASGSATPFPQFYNQEMEAIFNEIAPPQRSAIQKVYGGPLDPVGMAEEHVRQLIQAKMRGEITEQSLGEATIRYLKALLQKLQALFTAAVAPDRKTLLSQQLRAVESILTEQQARPPAERFEADGAIAGAFSPSLPTIKWTADQNQSGFGLLGVAILNNPAAEPLKMGGRINPQQLINRLRTLLPPDEMQWYAEAGIFNLAQNPNATLQDFRNFMQQKGPKVEVKVLQAGSNPTGDREDVEAHQAFYRLLHEMETGGLEYKGQSPLFTNGKWVSKFRNTRTDKAFGIDNESGRLVQAGGEQYVPYIEDNANVLEFLDRFQKLIGPFSDASDRINFSEKSPDSATARYTMVNPKPLDQMPGAVDILVRVPEITKFDLTPEQRESGQYIHGQADVRFRGSHFGQSDVNVLSWVRGYMETLPNSKKTFHIFEVQSDWGQKVRENREGNELPANRQAGDFFGKTYNTPTYPLLRDYNRLAIKAAIKHALDNGAESITISDAETAMLTEGHDRMAEYPIGVSGATRKTEIPQARGMRLNYDQVLPKIAQELTGFQGAPVSFGDHQNVFTGVPDGRFLDQGGNAIPRANLVFRNPDGTPKTTITGREFDLSQVRNRLNQTGGVFPLMGGGKFVQESPFDKMRRESGAEPAPELTPEEQAAKDRNERQRGMRPNPRFAGAFSPQDKLAAENGDEFWIRTEIGSTDDSVKNRIQMTPGSTVESQEHALGVFNRLGIKVKWLEERPATETQPSKGIWRYVFEKNFEGGRKLAESLPKEIEANKNNPTILASLINSIRYNNKIGHDVGVFDDPTRRALYRLAQSDASYFGLGLGAFSQHPANLPNVPRNVDVELDKIYYDAFGGEVIDEAMDKLRRGIQTFFSKPFIQQILAANPQLNESIEMINALGLGNQVPDAAQLIYEVFQTPFYKISDLAEMFRNKLVKDYGMDEGEAKKAGKRFQEAFDKHLKQAADEALKIATANLTYKKKVAVKSRKTVEQLLKDAIKKGQLDSGDVLREIAKENWGSTPSDADIAEMKRLANKHDELAALTPVEEAEVRKLEGDTPESVERARQIKEAGNQPVRVAIQKQMEVAWARMKKPINNPFINPVLWWRTRGNFAMAVNEFIAANILAKVSFATRQLVAIFSQWISYVPSRGIADALVNYQHARVNGQQSALPKEMASALRDGYKQQFGALLPALSAMRSALFGRAESRNVIQLMSDMATLERLTKNAEEHWNKANELMAAGNVAGASAEFSKASLFYFISMTKMGYRVAQGLDRLQGIPVHYQNMSQQVMRALRDAGKTVAEAETSRDFVIGDIKQQWLLAIPIAKNYLEQSGEKFSTQDIKNAAWNVVKRQQYHRIATLPIESDKFESQNEFLENTVGWNQREVRGLGGAVAGAMRKVEQVAESWGIPLVVTRFANAIGISINRSLAYTPLFKQANFGSGNESAWFKTETDRMQRRVEAAVGSALGSVAIGLVMSGYLVVRLKWPRDKEERDLWEREGHRPNTVEWKISDTEFIPFSLNNSPFMFVAPYLAAGGALRDAFDEQTKAQAKLDEEALKAGLPAGKAPGPGPADLFLVAAEAAKQVVLGGRTAAGLIGSVSSYGTPNAKKTTGSYVSALVPFAPAAQDISRMAGVRMDEKMASVWDFILPLPGSEARKVNMLGDPVSTPDDIQRVLQIMTGGTYPGVVNSGQARSEAGYQALFASGFRTPSISPGKGYDIRGVFRPMDDGELAKYTRTRGEYFKQALSGFGAAATMEEVRAAFQDANQRALRDIGAAIPATSQTQSRTTTTTRPTSFRRPRRSRYGSGLRRGRSPRLRSGRRIRALRRSPVRPQRRARLMAA